MAALPKKHAVKLAAILSLDPIMLGVVLLFKNHAVLLDSSEQYRVEAAT